MSALLKALLAVAVLLPVGGLVAGMLAAAETEPTPRETIVISSTGERGDSAVTGTTTGTATGRVGGGDPRPGTRFTAVPRPPTPPPPAPERDEDDVYDDPEPVVPQPVEVDGDDQDGGQEDDQDDAQDDAQDDGDVGEDDDGGDDDGGDDDD